MAERNSKVNDGHGGYQSIQVVVSEKCHYEIKVISKRKAEEEEDRY